MTELNEPEYMIVTPEQLQKGWMEIRGVTPIHHEFIVLRQLESGNYVVAAPKVKQWHP
jgi:hypothetical protein